MHLSRNKKIIYLPALLLIMLSVILSSCAPLSVKRTNIADIYEPEKSGAFHSSSGGETVYSSGSFDYAFDEKNMVVSVKSQNNAASWTTLPVSENTSSCAAAVQLIYKDKLYMLNTQDNSVAIGTASFEKNDAGVYVRYDLKTDGQSETLLSFGIDYSFSDDGMTVSCDTGSFVMPKGAQVIYFDLLPSFGESSNPSYGDYFIVPDGSGALMYTATHDSPTDNVEFDIYGQDPAISDISKPAVMPVFGNKRSSGAFISYITGGDSVACVCANRASDEKFAAVYPRFKLCSVSTQEGAVKYSGGFDGKISVIYMFLSAENADYSHMASRVREFMIKNSFMSESRVQRSGLPFVLNVIGYYSNGFMKKSSQTAFDECETLINLLKGKSITDIEVIYRGIFSGGIKQKKENSDSVLSSLGGGRGFDSLYSFTQSNGVGLTAGVSLFSGTSISSYKSSKNADGKTVVFNADNDMSRGDDDKLIGFNLLKPSQIERRISDILSLNVSDICASVEIRDAANVLYSDFSDSKVTREYTKKAISDAVSSISSVVDVTVTNGNFYLLNSVAGISDMPFDTFYTQGEAYYGIPFAQIVIHGYIPYWGKSVNLSENYKLYMLKCIEYGSLLSYEWVFDETSALYYGYTLNDATEYYNELSSALSGLENSTIISHTRIKNGVVCIKYENGATIYVNYNNYSVITDDNLTVLPYSALRVD